MVPFDGLFANNYVLPLAIAAYDATTPPAGFAKTWEVLADPSQNALLAARVTGGSTTHMDAYNAMIKQPRKPVAQTHDLAAAARTEDVDSGPNLHFGWVCADTAKNILIVTIRGTEYLAEWLKDFDFIGTPYQPVPGRGTVHQGFQIVYYSIRANLLGIIQEARTAYPALKTILVTGHSLGAAVAGLAAPDLITSAAKGLGPIVYTFAEPRVGHHDYAVFFNSVIDVCYRITNFWDVVPNLPPLLALYEHEGQELVIDSGFSLDVAHNHVLATGYVPGLAKWVQQHPVQATAHFGSVSIPTLVGVSP